MNALLNWLDDRTGYRGILQHTLYEPIPGGARWRYVWGSTLVFTFMLQVITGLFLWTAYAPSGQTAWESVYFIQYKMQWGWIVRGMHHFAAQAMVVLMAFHFMQVILDGAYKAPREVNFWLGIVLMLIVLGLSLTGYLLPWDQKGYYATQVATKIMGITPVVGSDMQHVVQGGPEYGHHTLTRFFALHAGVLPALLVMVLALHVYVFRRHAITPAVPHKFPKFAVVLTLLFGPLGMFYANSLLSILMCLLYGGGYYALWQAWGRGVLDANLALWIGLGGWFLVNAAFSPLAARSARTFRQNDAYFWPDQILKDAVACLAVLATVMGLTFYFRGAELTAPADPAERFDARPEWYFLFLFRFLKFESVGQFGESLGLNPEFFGSQVVPGLVMAVIVLMPILGRWKLGHRFNVAFLLALILSVAWLTGIAMYEDVHDPEFQVSKEIAHRDAARTVELAQAQGIPKGGARELLLADPKTQGPRVFARNCSACHRYDGHDGVGRPLPDAPTAADLGNFGTAAWARSVIVDFKTLFAPLARAKTPEGKDVGSAFLEGEMAEWSEVNHDDLLKPENKEALDALTAFLSAQSERKDAEPADPAVIAKGQELFTTADWPGGTLTSGTACADCHELKVAGSDEALGEGGAGEGYPTLTAYGSQTWLRDFIADPARHYGEKNAMPAFAERLSEEELSHLVRWMTGDYHRPAQEAPH